MSEFVAAAPRGRPRLDKWAFFVALVLGVAIIIGFDIAQRSKVEAVTVCVVLLCLYSLAVTKLPALKLRIDQAADNSYYLGLLFTLTSLGVALFSFASAEGASESILRNFGVAIFTTITGLGLRVLISQFREDPEDLEEISREALAETVRRLRGELDQSVAELQRFCEGARQALQETSEAARNNTTDTLTVAIERFESALTEAAKSFSENTTGFNKRASGINSALDKVTGAVESLTTRISSVRADETLIRDALAPAFEGVSQALSGLTATVEDQRSRLENGLATLTAFADVLQRFEGSADSFNRATVALQGGVAALGEGPAQVARLASAVADAATAGERLSDAVSSAAGRAGAAAEQSILRLEQASTGVSERAAAQLAAINDAAERVSATLSRLDTEFAGSGETVERVRRELTELASWIIARLERA